MSHENARSAVVVGGLAVIVLLSVPLSAFAASMRGGGAEHFPQGAQTIHVKLDQTPGLCTSGTIGLMGAGAHGIISTDFAVTCGDLASGDLSGTATVTQGTPPTVFCLQGTFTATIVPEGPGVGSFTVFINCGFTVVSLEFHLDTGLISFSP